MDVKFYEINHFVRTKEELKGKCEHFSNHIDDIWQGEGYYIVVYRSDAIWYEVIDVKTPETRIKELESKLKEIRSEMILMKSYTEKSKNLMLWWEPGGSHCELTVDDVETIVRLYSGERFVGFFGTILDLMLSGF